MPRTKTNSEEGSAILEFLVFVMLGQLLIMVFVNSISSELELETRLQLFANTLVRVKAPLQPQFEQTLRTDYRLPDATVKELTCSQNLVCLQVSQDKHRAIGVGLR